MINIEHALSALNFLDAGCHRTEWIQIGMAAKAAGLSFEYFHIWSKDAANYAGEKDCLTAWNSFDESGGITAATLFHRARQAGWKTPKKSHLNPAKSRHKDFKKRNNSENNTKKDHSIYALEIWETCLPADNTHAYIFKKQGNPDGLRVYPSDARPLIILGQNVGGYLAVPCFSNGKIQTLQFIPPNGDVKLNLSGEKFNDGYFVVGQITNCIYVCEGLSAAWTINKASGSASVVSFGVSRMLTVAKVLRSQYPLVQLILVSDRGQEELASKIAAEVAATWIELPSETPENYDVGDYAQEHGYEKLSALLKCKKTPPMPLNTILANTLPEIFIPADELIEGILISGDGSILYGDSNSGKTFLVIDMACAIARGIDWMGRKTELGLVVYLAAESPASVRRRLQAYQKHHNVRIENFAIVQNPINLFDSDADINAVIELIHLLEKQRGQKVRLIVGDTLARLSAGANENAGQDMGMVVKHFDQIRKECDAHFMLIHHSGKNAAAGARGWSGVRAAVDTEIEITDSSAGRCAEITKQRDLGTKGIRIGFRLETVSLGLTKWKSPATSCVVVHTDAPPKTISRRTSEVGGAIVEYLRSLNKAIKKTDIREHFSGQYTSSAVYRQIRALRDTGIINDTAGYINLVPISAN